MSFEEPGRICTSSAAVRISKTDPDCRPGCPPQERFYFGDTVLPLFESGIPLLRERLATLDDRANVTIAYPDEGAWKRFKYQFDEYPEARLSS